jgi:putative ABC transport system permease protein
MRHFWPDMRFGIRMLLRHPTLSVASILTFGLGIGLTTAVFSVVNGVLYKGLPFDEGDRIVLVAGADTARGVRLNGIDVHDYVVFDERQRVFESLGAFTWVSINMAWDQRLPERFSGAALTVGSLRATRVKPILGRAFRDGDDRPGAVPVLLLGYHVWRDRFGSAQNVVGKIVRANGVARTIVGVMPEGFAFPNLEEVWIPLEIDPLATARGRGPRYEVMARLRPDVSVATAQAQLTAMAARLAKDFPDTNRGIGVQVMPFLERAFGSRLRMLCGTMLGAGIGVLLVACVNVSNLLLARASLRQREVAVRQALGAGRGRLLAQMLTEVSILAAAGGVLGLVINTGAVRWFVAAIQSNPPPFFVSFDPDARVLLFVLAITLAAGVAAGLVPAWRATRLDVTATLTDGSRVATGFRIGRLSGGLVVVEMTVSCALLIVAGLMVKSVAQVKTAQLPFAVDGVSTAWIDLPRAQYPHADSRARFVEQLLTRVQAHPGIEAAAIADGLPADGNDEVPVQIRGQERNRGDEMAFARRGRVTPGYFKTFQSSIRRGREFTAFDQPDQERVAVVNESFRRRFFRGVDPIGQQFRQDGRTSNAPWLTVVGVVPDLLMQGFRSDLEGGAGYYVPVAQGSIGNYAAFAVRVRRGAAVTAATLQGLVASLDKDLAIYNARSMQAVVDQQTLFHSVFGTFFLALGGAGLFLAAAGLYGVMSFSVTRRTRELAIRSAVGASRSQLVRLVMRKAAAQSCIGLTLGLALGLLATGPLQPVLYEVDPRDPLVLACVVATLAATGLVAGLLAMRGIVRVDPTAALGAE